MCLTFLERENNFIVAIAVNGALRCLALLSSDMDDRMVPKIIPVLFPCLHTIVSSPQVSHIHYLPRCMHFVNSRSNYIELTNF